MIVLCENVYKTLLTNQTNQTQTTDSVYMTTTSSSPCLLPTSYQRVRWDIELVTYLANTVNPVSLVLDLLITHDRFGSSSDLNLNGPLHYPNDIHRSLNESVSDKIRKYRSDYNNNPPNYISFMPAIATTSGKLHSEFVRLLFLQAHRKTYRFFCRFRSSDYTFKQ